MSQLKQGIPEHLLEQFSQYLCDTMGLYYPKKAWEGFEKKLHSIASAFGYKDPVECIRKLMSSPMSRDDIVTLANHLTIGETYFFRDTGTFAILEKELLPAMISAKRDKCQHIRAWSAACCTGEEPYSLAMLFHKLIPDLSRWNISILGTDINPNFLKRARQAIYGSWSFRTISQENKARYFTKIKEKTYRLSPEIADMVKFMYLNLVEDSYPSLINGTSGLDLIFCNNVLIYFSENQINKVVKQLTEALVEGGFLFVTAIEAPYVNNPDLVQVKYSNAIAFQKISSHLQTKVHLERKDEKQQSHKKDKIINVELPRFINTEKKILEFDFTAAAAEGKQPTRQAAPPASTETPLLSASIQNKITYKQLTNEYEGGRYNEIIAILENEYTPDDVIQNGDLAKILIRSYANIGELEKALDWTEMALIKHQIDPALHFLHATIIQELGRLDEAVDALKKTLFLDSNYIIAYFTLGNIMLMQDKTVEADRNFRNATRLLKKETRENVIESSEGLTAGRLLEIIEGMRAK